MLSAFFGEKDMKKAGLNARLGLHTLCQDLPQRVLKNL